MCWPHLLDAIAFLKLPPDLCVYECEICGHRFVRVGGEEEKIPCAKNGCTGWAKRVKQ